MQNLNIPKRLIAMVLTLALAIGALHVPTLAYSEGYGDTYAVQVETMSYDSGAKTIDYTGEANYSLNSSADEFTDESTDETANNGYTEYDGSYGDNYVDEDYGYDNGYNDNGNDYNDSGYSGNDNGYNDNGYSDNDYEYNDNNYSDNDYNYENDDYEHENEDGDYEYGEKEECEEDCDCEDCELELEEIAPPVLGGLGIVPFNGGANIEITAFTSANQVFTTNDSNMLPLTLQVAYRIVGDGNAAGGEIRVALEDDATHPKGTFFATTLDRINVTLSDAGQQHIDAAGIFVESAGGQNTLVIPFIGGQNNVTLDTITITIEYNRVWDGTIPPGSALNTFEAWAVNDGVDSPEFAINVTSNTTDTRVLQQVGEGGAAGRTLIIGQDFFIGGALSTSNNIIFRNITPRLWQYEAGTQLTITVQIPPGAELGTLTSNNIGGVARTPQIIGNEMVWEIDIADIGNQLDLFFAPRMMFPTTHFSPGQLDLHITATYHLQNAITGEPHVVNSQLVVPLTLIEGGGIPGGEIILAWNPADISMMADSGGGRDVSSDDIRVDNQNNLPLENVVITFYNNPDVSGAETGSKAYYISTWLISNAGSQVTSIWTFFIRDEHGSQREIEFTHNGADVSPGERVSFNIRAAAGVAAHEYIERIEIRPQHNGNNALAPGTEFRIRARPSGFPAPGIDHTGGLVGVNDDGFSDIIQRVRITYDGLAEAFENEFRIRVFPFAYEAVDARIETLVSPHGGVPIAPGEMLPVTVRTRAGSNTNNTHLRTIGTLWERPSFLVFVPADASIDTSQPVEAFRSLSNESLGNMTIEFLGTESTGQRVYRMQTQTGVSVTQISTSQESNSMIRFSFGITTPLGVSAGNTNMRIWIAPYAGDGVQRTLYQARGMNAFGLTITTNNIYADTNNWTGHNHLAPSLRIMTANFAYTVATSAGMLARAQMWNHSNNAWQLGGVATVPVGDEGRFQLEVVNSGNQFVGDVRLYNILPHTAVTNTASGVGSVTSEWNAALSSLDFRVYDRFGAEITSTFTGSQIFVSQQTNSNPSTNNPINRNLINSDFAAINATNIETARSFVFDLGANRLPPGARIVIEGNVALPATMTADDIGETAQNSFVTSGQFFNGPTGTAGQVPTPQIANIQTFESTAENNASISGTVFRALASGVRDGELEGVTVRLYAGVTAVVNFTGLTAATDADGEFEFTGLAPGTYYLRFMNPITAATGMTETFVGTGLTADGRNGVTGAVTLNASATGHEFTANDVELVRTGLVQAQFRRADNSLVGNVTHTIHSNVNLDVDAAGAVAPGEAGQIALPTGYSISGSASQNFALTWNAPHEVLVFDVTRDQFTVVYDNNEGTGTITQQTANTNTNITLSDGTGFSRTGHTLQGWATAYDGAVVYALGATFTRAAAGTATLFAVWEIDTFQITFNLTTGTGTVPAAQTIDHGDTATAPDAEAMALVIPPYGHHFVSWYDAPTGGEPFDFAAQITSSATAYARFAINQLQVSYDKDGYIPTGAPATPSARDVAFGTPNVSGTTITPTWVDGYENGVLGIWTFSGWEAPAPLGHTFTMPNANVVFSGEWEFSAGTPNVIYTVTDARPPSYDGMPASPQTETSGQPVTVAPIPTTIETVDSAGTAGTWTFNGWNHATITGPTFTMPNDNVEFTGYWIFEADEFEVTYTVTDTRPATYEGMPASPQTVAAGTANTAVAAVPTTIETTNAEGTVGTWTFNGWNHATITGPTFTMPNGNVEFTGYWIFEADEFEVTYTVTDTGPATYEGMPTSPQTVAAGTADVVVAPIPTTTETTNAEGTVGTWTFNGWNHATITGPTFTMPNGNVEFTGYWIFEADEFEVTYTVTDTRPATYEGMPTSPQTVAAGTADIEVAPIPTTTETTNAAGIAGTWEFNGWNHPTITGSVFTMPNYDVEFTGSWTFTQGGGNNGGGNNGGGTTPPEMIKVPDRAVVRVGETINWTLQGFHNRSGEEVSSFTVVDMPGRGLNFQSGRLPAFMGGEGITYEIRYRVAGSDWRTHATGIDASQPFNFSLPQSGNLHYTEIGFFFGDVPAYFGLNNQIVLTFIVGEGAPNNMLVNDFVVRYGNIERPGGSPQNPIIVPPGTPGTPGTPGGPDGGAGLPGTPPGTSPVGETAQQPGVIAPGTLAPTYDQQIFITPPFVYGVAGGEQFPSIVVIEGYPSGQVEQVDGGAAELEARANPQTSDNNSFVGLLASMFGFAVSAAVILFARRRLTGGKNA